MIKKLFNHEAKSISSGAFVIAVFYLINGVLAILRNTLLASHFGAGRELDIYYSAFRIPDLIYTILISGALSVGFIPIFAEKLVKSKEEAWRFCNNILTTLTLILGIGALLVAIFAPLIVPLLVPGFDKISQQAVTKLVQIMMIQPIVLGVSNIIVGILQNFRRFFVTSLAPLFYNFGIIIGVVVFVPLMGLKGLAWGVVLGALMHFLIQLPSLKNLGFSFKFLPDFRSENLKQIFTLAGPRLLGLISIQINFFIITVVASTLQKGSLAVFNFANDLQNFPQNIFAISFAVSVFPILSQLFDRKEEFSKLFRSTMKNILVFMLPAAVFYFVLRSQIVRLTLGYGHFDWLATNEVISVLGIFSFGMIATGLLPLMVRLFFSTRDAIKPLIAGLINNGLNIILSLFLGHRFGVVGLAVAFSITDYCGLILLMVLFKKEGINLGWREIFMSASKIIVASVAAGLSGFGILRAGELFLNTHTISGLLIQAGSAFVVGILIYLLILRLIAKDEFFYFKRFFKKFSVGKQGLETAVVAGAISEEKTGL